MTTTHSVTHLEDGLRLFSSELSRVSTEAWTRPQNGKWTIAQETAHILKANQRTAQLLSSAARSLWHPNTRPSRSYEAIQEEYQTALASNPGIVNAPTAPGEDAAEISPSEQLTRWQQTAEVLLQNVANLTEEDLDGYTVWKHPLLGPLTTREMVHFTDYHTRHHAASLSRKQGTGSN